MVNRASLCVVLPVQDQVHLIAEAISSARLLGDEVLVVDGGSKDGTLEEALKIATCVPEVQVVERPYDNSAAQKNFGLARSDSDYVFFLDADERPSSALVEDVRRMVSSGEVDGALVERRNLFIGKWIRHGGWSPDFNLRLIRARSGARYEDRVVHEHVVGIREPKVLQGYLLHDTSPSLDVHLQKTLRWTRLEAEVRLNTPGRLWPGLGPRIFIRNLLDRMPMRPLLRFVYMYILRFGFLDGGHGLNLAILSACSEAITGVRVREAKRERK